MSNLYSAAQMALDAMKSFESGTNGLFAGEFAEEIAALSSALAEPEKCPPDMCLHCVALQQRLDTLTEAVMRSHRIA